MPREYEDFLRDLLDAIEKIPQLKPLIEKILTEMSNEKG